MVREATTYKDSLLNASANLEPRHPEHMSHTLLLIDDNAIQAATRQTILKRAGYFVIAVLNPAQALERLRANNYSTPIDFIITDHIMPGMNGSEFVARLRKFAPDIPVLVISGMAEAEEEYKTLGVDFRVKPLLPENLLASVHQIIESKASAKV
jgi:CheY-like chemotaxis protein